MGAATGRLPSMPQLMVVIASTRPGRVGLPVGQWFVQRARDDGRFDVVIADLAEWNLPFLDEPNHPRLRQYTRPHTLRWSAAVDAADAFVFIMPEYNHGFNAPLKNAFDFLHQEWEYKPVAFVTYGGIAAGTRALQMMKQVVISVKMVPLNDAVNIPFVRTAFDDDGAFSPSEAVDRAAGVLLDELVRVQAATQTLRTPGPAG
jgi:NAD(P)H-dependent FMN reductase